MKTIPLVPTLMISMLFSVPVFAAAKLKPKSISQEEKRKVVEEDKNRIKQLFAAYKTALSKPDYSQLQSICAGETQELIAAAKTGDDDTKKYLTTHFRDIGKALTAGKFAEPYAVGDTVFIKGKNESSLLIVEFIQEKGAWKVLSATVDDSEASAKKLTE
jgi:hypothetical protein